LRTREILPAKDALCSMKRDAELWRNVRKLGGGIVLKKGCMAVSREGLEMETLLRAASKSKFLIVA